MRVTEENIENIPIKEREQALLKALLIDLEEINSMQNSQLYIDWQEWHNEYNPERTDPCPDYYGMYTVRDNSNPNEILGVEMNIDDLDTALCLLYNFAEMINSLINDI